MMIDQSSQPPGQPARPADGQDRTDTPDPPGLSGRASGPHLARRLPGFLVSVAVGTVAPLLCYSQLRHLAGSQVTALMIASLIPVTWTLGKLAVRRRLDPVGVLSVVGFGVGIVLLALTGSGFAFKIHGPVLTGALGFACLGSMLIRRPLGLLVLLPRSRPWIPGMTRRTAAYWITGIWGVILVTEAAVVIILAAVLPTPTFLTTQQPVGLSFLALAIGCLIWRKRHGPAAQPAELQETRS